MEDEFNHAIPLDNSPLTIGEQEAVKKYSGASSQIAGLLVALSRMSEGALPLAALVHNVNVLITDVRSVRNAR